MLGDQEPTRRSRRTLQTRSRALFVVVAAAGAVAIAVVIARAEEPTRTGDATLTELHTAVAAGQVAHAELDATTEELTATLVDGEELRVALPPDGSGSVTDELVARDVDVEVVRSPAGPPVWARVLTPVLPVVIVLGALILLLRGRMGMPGGRSTARAHDGPPPARFHDVAGIGEVAEELEDVVAFLRHPERFHATGARIPRGVLLVGGPGTGKTLLAKAVAGEAGVPFFPVTGSDFVETFVGVGAARVRDLFAKARKHGGIVFIDEIDSIGRARGAGPTSGGVDEAERTLNMLLAEMDGFSARDRVFVLAATNRLDVLDPALLRPGRFDRTVHVPAPDVAGRTSILELYAGRHPMADDVDLAALARRVPGMTGADLANLVNEAAILAAKAGRDQVDHADLDLAVARARMGPERRSRIQSDRQRSIVAWHEAGHALTALVTEDAEDPVQVSIVPRGVAGGVTWFDSTDEMFVTTRQARAQLTVALAGRAAEELLLDGDVTQGAEGDLAHATELAHRMVTRWGMSELGVGHFAPDVAWRGGDQDAVRAEVDRLVRAALDDARAVLGDHRDDLEAVVDALLEHETLDRSQLATILDRHAAAGRAS
jgi:cell division protease FtsH